MNIIINCYHHYCALIIFQLWISLKIRRNRNSIGWFDYQNKYSSSDTIGSNNWKRCTSKQQKQFLGNNSLFKSLYHSIHTCYQTILNWSQFLCIGDKLLIPILLLLDHAIYLLLKHAKSMLHKLNNSGVKMRKREEITIWTTLHLNYWCKQIDMIL